MEPLYTQYITKHPTALEHLNNLPNTPALTAYLAHTRTLAQSLTHAWDLPSLLIKPVQRLLKYSLLLGAVIDETPATHGDKANLKMARERMEAVAHGVNEGRRRREVVKEVLTGTPVKKIGEQQKAKKKGLNVNVATSVNLGRMKTLRTVSWKSREGIDSNEETERVAMLGVELRETDAFIRQIAKDAVACGKSVTALMEKLREWAFCFGRVIDVSGNQGSDAFEAFLDVIRDRLLPMCGELENVIEDRLISQLARLRDSSDAPERLLEAMYTLEPLHNGLLNINISRQRPPAQLLEASKSYLALRGQLFEELPRYLQLLHRGIAHCVAGFASMQTEFWLNIRMHWGDLWDALKVEGEMQGEAAETLRVWWERFEQVEAAMQGLVILSHPVPHPIELRAKEGAKEGEKEREKEATSSPSKSRSRKRAMSSSVDLTSSSTFSVRGSLDPFHTPPLSSRITPSKTRSMQSLDSGTRRLDRKNSNESVRSRKSGKSLKSGKPSQYASMSTMTTLVDPLEGEDTVYPLEYPKEPSSPSRPTYDRTKSMPISYPMQLKKSESQGRLLGEFNGSENISRTTLIQTPEPENERGRTSRKTSIRKRLAEHFRPILATTPPRRQGSPPCPTFPSPQPIAEEVVPSTALYSCSVVHMCDPPEGVHYLGFPFFTLIKDEIYHVLVEAGHPSSHVELPLYVDDGEDCLLLVHNSLGENGWALASFLEPL